MRFRRRKKKVEYIVHGYAYSMEHPGYITKRKVKK